MITFISCDLELKQIKNPLVNIAKKISIICGLITPYGDRDLGQHWFR